MSTTSPSSTARAEAPTSALDRFFHISERGSTIAREVRGGLVTFFTMAYILVLNPLILSTPHDGVTPLGTTAQIAAGTAFIAAVMTILMGVVANYPMALAAGLGINAMVAYTIAGTKGMTYADAMGLIVIEGVIILLLVLTGFREAVFRAVPAYLKTAISVGIGLFIALIGLVDAKVVRPGGTPLELGLGGSLQGWPVLVFLLGLFLILVLHVRKVKGAILIGIVSSTILAAIIEAVAHLGAFNDNPERGALNLTGWSLSVPALKGSPVELPSLATLGHFNLLGSIEKVGIVSVVLLVFSLLLADFFDTMGTMVAIGSEGDLLDEGGNPPKTREILVVDSLAAIAGGAGGVSSNTSYIESAAGVGEGARTGLASVVTGLLFLASMFIAPVVSMVPYEAATPALVVVGFLMMTQVTEIDWKAPEVALPAFITIIMMPFSYSITNGIGAGFVSYLVIQVARGKIKAIHPLMWVASLMFVVYFTLTPIKAILGIG
ncbi:Guanine/hypoxanthine permease pbuG [Actinomyces bovis]|uniref:Guanine/hypoxanthine permease pbuG n=1 Tax=Actinomyces bovis TaxID=1658 RepID=A0ABY1VQ41_9ACTO|nr:NCS2 family permease [Actinomyces bovis]SPT54236.1 Guanine/hypoxanthine permease pbuG [Actinomyces bovis]VEG56482.1 Guanine/hypoxanthine permease pbuG [Actinomyces israelii]